MGRYINQVTHVQLPTSYEGKIETLIKLGAKRIETPTKWEEGLCCAVDNGLFGAVGYAYDDREMEVFKKPTGRPTTWLYFPDAKNWAE